MGGQGRKAGNSKEETHYKMADRLDRPPAFMSVATLARELDVNLGAEYDHVAQAKAMEAHEHASAGLVGLARIVRETVTTPTYFTDAVAATEAELPALLSH